MDIKKNNLYSTGARTDIKKNNLYSTGERTAKVWLFNTKHQINKQMTKQTILLSSVSMAVFSFSNLAIYWSFAWTVSSHVLVWLAIVWELTYSSSLSRVSTRSSRSSLWLSLSHNCFVSVAISDCCCCGCVSVKFYMEIMHLLNI